MVSLRPQAGQHSKRKSGEDPKPLAPLLPPGAWDVLMRIGDISAAEMDMNWTTLTLEVLIRAVSCKGCPVHPYTIDRMQSQQIADS